jgi:hypothetical protein
MKNIIENNEDRFANGQVSRDLRVNAEAREPETQLDAVTVIEQSPHGGARRIFCSRVPGA